MTRMTSHTVSSPSPGGSLFSEEETPAAGVQPASPSAAITQLAGQVPATAWLGTSSWHYPGWGGLVWDRIYTEKQLSQTGLPAYAQYPLFAAVGLDRGFYRPLTVAQYAGYAADVPDAFRFVVKAPSQVTDALIRDAGGKGKQPNPDFLQAQMACEQFVAPACQGMGHKLGALVFQISPLSRPWLRDMSAAIDRLHAMLRAAVDATAAADTPGAVVAVEVRNPEWLTPDFIAALKDARATYCLGLHPRMPPIDQQLPILRQLWPGPFVCRWNLNIKHGAFGYERARALYSPFDTLVDPDTDTRNVLARVIAGTVGAGQPAFVTVSNKAEGSAPLSVGALAAALASEVARRQAGRDGTVR